jgi:hypothetical protein
MSKTLHQLSFKDIIENALEYCHEEYQENYDHDTYSNPVPYGDTYVSSGNYITEESEERATEKWKDDFSIDDFVKDYLLESCDFREKIMEMVEEF